MNIDNLAVVYLLIVIAIPAAIIILLVYIVNSQKKIKSEIELLKRSINDLENK